MINRFVKLFISILFLAGYKCYCAVYHSIRKKSPATLVVLTYHAITSNQRLNFVRQMDMLKKYHLIFSDTRIDLNAGRHYVAVTFDDGFESVVENALPELVKRGIPATLFIPSGHLGQRPGWITNLNNTNFNESVMSPGRLQSIQSDLLKIGSHSVTHRSLTQLQEQETMKELVDSKMKLETLLHDKITSFSFPYGAYNTTVLKLAKKAGYTSVFCSWPIFPLSRMNGFLIGRTPASPDDTALEFRLKIMGAYQWLPVGISLKRKVYTVLKFNNFAGSPSAKRIWG